MADKKHDTSIRGQLESMVAGQVKAFPIKRMQYIKNIMSILNSVNYGVHKWVSKTRKEQAIIEIIKLS